MLKSGVTLMAAVLFCLVLSTTNVVSGPLTFTHQGRLLDASDQPVDGFFDIEYRIYTDSTGGSPIYSEMHPNVEVTNGLFTAELGGFQGFMEIFTELSYDAEVWMEIQIEGSVTPISPRMRLAGALYAMLADGVSSQHVFMSGGQVYTADAGMGVNDSTASLRLRIIPTSQTTGRIAMEVTQQGSEIAIGDPDFDLLRMTGDAAGANMSITGDPDFDLLRLSSNSDTAKISMSGRSIGDPDFDLLRIVGSPSGADIRLSGDPDFDLLRMSADADSAEIEMSGQVIGDPDFDLLRIVGSEGHGSMTMQVKNSIGNIRGCTQSVDSGGGSYAIGEEGVQKIRLDTDSTHAGIAVNEEGVQITISADSGGGGSIAVNEEGTHNFAVSTDSNRTELAIGEEGVQITMRADSGGGGSYAIGEEGVQKIRLDTDSTHAGIAVNEEGIQIAISTDSGGVGSIAILAGVAIPKFLAGSDGNGYLSNSLKIGTTSGTNHIEVVGGANCDGTSWNNGSDVASKENFQDVDGEDILERLEELDITRWNYKGKEDAEHIGPTAQDFYKAFSVGGDDKTISTIDPSGIALAAIKELYKKSKEIDQLKKQLEELTEQVEKLAKERK